jgi:hypothetical protein
MARPHYDKFLEIDCYVISYVRASKINSSFGVGKRKRPMSATTKIREVVSALWRGEPEALAAISPFLPDGPFEWTKIRQYVLGAGEQSVTARLASRLRPERFLHNGLKGNWGKPVFEPSSLPGGGEMFDFDSRRGRRHQKPKG